MTLNQQMILHFSMVMGMLMIMQRQASLCIKKSSVVKREFVCVV